MMLNIFFLYYSFKYFSVYNYANDDNNYASYIAPWRDTIGIAISVFIIQNYVLKQVFLYVKFIELNNNKRMDYTTQMIYL